MQRIGIHYIGFIVLIVLSIGCTQKKSGKGTVSNSDTTSSQVDILTSKINSDNTNGNLYHDRAKYYLNNKMYNEAFNDAWKAIELDSLNSEYHITISDIYLGTGKLQAAVQSLEKASQINPENINSWLKLAEITLAFKDYKSTINYLDEALQLDDLEPKAYFFRGVVFMETGDTLRSIRNFQKAIEVDQSYFDAHLQLGVLFAERKNKLAVDYFNNALNIEPGNINVSYLLAMYYQETNSFKEAIKIYNSILSKDPEFFYATYNIGYIHLVYFEQYESAIEYFTKTIDISPDYFDAYYNRGFAYELLKDVEKSRADYQKVLELKTNYQKAIEGLNRIDDFVGQ